MREKLLITHAEQIRKNDIRFILGKLDNAFGERLVHKHTFPSRHGFRPVSVFAKSSGVGILTIGPNDWVDCLQGLPLIEF